MKMKFCVFLLVFCIICSNTFIYKSADAENYAEYSMGGAAFGDHFNVTSKYYMKTKNRKLYVNGTIYCAKNGNVWTLKPKKRTFTISSKCKYVCVGYDEKKKATSYTGKSYAKFKKLSKYWMDGRGDKKTGTYNDIFFEIYKGKIRKIVLSWCPYEG